MRLVLLGPPGAGKGTQAAAIRDRLGIPHISTGDMLRAAIALGTPVGQKARAIVEGGNLVPDDVMAAMVRERLGRPDCAGGFLLDGYPRNVEQARTLKEMLDGLGRALDGALYLTLGDAEIVRRISGRRTCAACGATYHVDAAPSRAAGVCDACGAALTVREDDREEVVSQRLRVYRERTEPVVDFYRAEGILKEVSAAGSVAQVGARVLAFLANASPAGHGGQPRSTGARP